MTNKEKVSHKGLIKDLIWPIIVVGVILLALVIQQNLDHHTLVNIRTWLTRFAGMFVTLGIILIAYGFIGIFIHNRIIKVLIMVCITSIVLLLYLFL